MTRTKIVIASVLKPVYEPRMYEKIGITLSKIPESEVHVVGYGNVDKQLSNTVQAWGLGQFKRLSFKRLFASWHVFRLLLQLKPDVVIAGTHELLFPLVCYKLLHRKVSLVYDVQENYYLNILHTHAFPTLLRWPLALWVRLKERLLLPFFSSVLVAEHCYLQEMPFLVSKSTVVANKALAPLSGLATRTFAEKRERTCLLFSGTISTEYGIYEAIHLTEQLYQADPSFYLHIVGYCANDKERQALQEYVVGKPFVQAEPFDQPIPHAVILKAMREADWGLIAYRENTATKNRIPTKLYEYISAQLPVLSTTNTTWQELISTYDAGLCINYKQTHIDLLIRLLKMPGFYRNTADVKELFWDGKELEGVIRDQK